MSEKDEVIIANMIECAEEIKGPLDGIMELAESNPNGVFTSEILKELRTLRENDPTEFDVVLAQLGRIGVDVRELDRATLQSGRRGRPRQPAQEPIVYDLLSFAELFRSPDGTPFADIVVNGHRETWRIDRDGFKAWVQKRFYEETSSALRPDVWRSVVDDLIAQARYRSPTREVFMRVAANLGRLFIDLGDTEWRVVEITPEGYEVISNPPVRFHRTAGMEPLPLPEQNGSIDDLRRFLNLASEDDFVLVVAWMLAALRNPGPYPLLALTGEQGTAKSTCASFIRELVDPNASPLRAPPRDYRDLIVAANNAHVLVYDNLSSLPEWMSDGFCRLLSGGGHAARRLYTDDGEILFKAQRPVLLTSIEPVVDRQDLADRQIAIQLRPIARNSRMTETALWSDFAQKRGGIFGALCQMLVHGLRTLPEIRPAELPRMADFMTWGMACETDAWRAGTIEKSYGRNRQECLDSTIEADLAASGVLKLIIERTQRTQRTHDFTQLDGEVLRWEGTASDLHEELGSILGERVTKDKNWPRSAQGLSYRLNRVAPFLRERGVEIKFRREGRERTRIIRIYTHADWLGSASTSSASSAERLEEAIPILEPKEATINPPSDTAEPAPKPSITRPVVRKGTRLVMGPDGQTHRQTV